MTAVAVHNALKRFILRKEFLIIADFKRERNRSRSACRLRQPSPENIQSSRAEASPDAFFARLRRVLGDPKFARASELDLADLLARHRPDVGNLPAHARESFDHS